MRLDIPSLKIGESSAASVGLLAGLAAYWRLEEASGTRADATNAHALTDTNTVTQNPGKINNAAQFTAANLETLDSNDSNLSLTGDFTISAWIYFDTLVAQSDGRGIASFHAGDAIGDWSFHVPSGGGATGGLGLYHWKVAGTDGTGKHATTVNTGIATAATWYHVLARRLSGVYTLWLNGVSQALAADASSASGWGNTKFSIGSAWKAGVTASYNWDGRIDELGIWNRALMDLEIARLYNGGAGLTYPF